MEIGERLMTELWEGRLRMADVASYLRVPLALLSRELQSRGFNSRIVKLAPGVKGRPILTRPQLDQAFQQYQSGAAQVSDLACHLCWPERYLRQLFALLAEDKGEEVRRADAVVSVRAEVPEQKVVIEAPYSDVAVLQKPRGVALWVYQPLRNTTRVLSPLNEVVTEPPKRVSRFLGLEVEAVLLADRLEQVVSELEREGVGLMTVRSRCRELLDEVRQARRGVDATR